MRVEQYRPPFDFASVVFFNGVRLPRRRESADALKREAIMTLPDPGLAMPASDPEASSPSIHCLHERMASSDRRRTLFNGVAGFVGHFRITQHSIQVGHEVQGAAANAQGGRVREVWIASTQLDGFL